MKRRTFLSLGSAAVAGSAFGARTVFAQTKPAKVLRFVPLADLASIDPIVSTAVATRNHAYLIYEGLYGLDANLAPQPQMAEGHLVDDDGKRLTFKLRSGLVFHNGEPVRAADVVASLKRWMKRVPHGITLADRTESLEAPDDRTVVLRLKQPFPAALWLIAKATPSTMPEYLANTDPSQSIKEAIGSGAFRFAPGEYIPGGRAVYERNDRYQPRQEPASYTAGGRQALVDRIEWRSIPDVSTATSALITGEVDWIDQVLPDVLPLLKTSADVSVDRLDQYGLIGELIFNHLQGPTANPAIRRAILAAVDQTSVMRLTMGDDNLWKAPIGCFTPGTPSANDAAMDVLGTPPKSKAEIQAMLKEAGYNNERLVGLHASDHPFYGPMMQVVAARLTEVGFNVDDVTMDLNTVYQRRLSKEPLDKGGWSMFITAGNGFLDFSDPASPNILRGIGEKGFYGWPTNAKLESLRNRWLASGDLAEQKQIAADMQREALTTGHWAPLGQYFQYSAWRNELKGMNKSPVPLFWGVSKG
ncbi:ABC transporter substrate-binding protein [Chelatococcus asaccharovorans]|uniref:Peptide/nickel transport system substrate-binding protein n=1 Tax=Chelatococcus asaccharovorans TaxID=28210 RepID=A0A2V3TZX1_9HYPH|nr:ABC transporter substrate-binding protein [Chelatococcus asaccharovorans]MBS7707723.1 ABC transporter substrate-binding protein [Chelatococcus asaccharovorans]PXW55300.1 peptide/nickel transport system substrate-binding protein [Chelatococcus asaccharovorans]